MLPTSFTTKRLLLRPIATADAQAVFDTYAQDPEVSRYLTWRPHADIMATRSYVAACIASIRTSTYPVILQDSSRLIGSFDLRQHEDWRLGFGYVLARPYWGRGLMTEVLGAVVAWSMDQPDNWRIGDVVDVENHASARVMQKSGLRREGVLRRWALHPNVSTEPRDCFVYAKVRGAA